MRGEPWCISAAGSISFDDITTPFGRRRHLLGGSAVFFGLAASSQARVDLVGIVGHDGLRALEQAFRGLPVGFDGVTVSELRTERWLAVHDYERGTTASEECDEGAAAHWSPRLPEPARAAPVLFVGSMRPQLQLDVIAQCDARLIGVDTMTAFIASDPSRVHAVVQAADILFVTRVELGALVGCHPDAWLPAARSICGRGRLGAVVVKAGAEGAAWVTGDRVISLGPHPVSRVVDPTGAGDALAGGFLGACARHRCAAPDSIAEIALHEGLSCASRAISTFGATGLRRGAPRHRVARPGVPPSSQSEIAETAIT